MKTLFTPALFVLFSICSLKAQTTFGVKGGPSLSFMSIDDHKSVLLFHAGAFGEIPLNDKFFLRPELLFSRKGTMQTRKSDYYLDFAFSYLCLPAMAGLKATDRLSLLIGPEISYMLDGRMYVYDDQVATDAELFASWDLAIDFGMAYQIAHRLSAEFRYCHGLINVIDIMFTDPIGRPIGSLDEGKNIGLQLSLSYVLSSKKS